MNRSLIIPALLSALLVLLPAASRAGFLDDVMKELSIPAAATAGLDDATVVKGLKEALATGTGNAVASVSKTDGYFGNQLIRIVMPERLRTAADLLGNFGFRQEVDDFVLAMNRAAEKAAPKAREHFITALKAMTFEDAQKILQGGDTSATDYFRRSTDKAIFAEFKPVVSSSLKDVGAVQSYRQMTDSFKTIPFAGSFAEVDLDSYVTSKAVDGLFTMIGEEEKKIRTNPAARSTELLKKVFGK
jgi:RNA binding exosome subunit